MIISKQYLFFAILFLFSLSVNGNEIEDLQQAIADKAPREKIVNLCKIASRTGDPDLIAVVEPLLKDPDLSHPARYVLERIDSPKAGSALRSALSVQDPRLLSGIIGSLGKRSESENSAAIAPFLSHKDPDVVRTAAFALGKQGTEDAAAILLKFWAKGSAKAKTEGAIGLLAAADLLAQKGKKKMALDLLNAVWSSRDLPNSFRSSAAGTILDLTGDPDLQKTLLLDKDPRLAEVLLPYGRSLKDRSEVNGLCIDHFDSIAVKARETILLFLSETADPKVRNFLLKKGISDDPSSIPALKMLGKTGDLQTAKSLLNSLNDRIKKEKADAVFYALSQMNDPGINDLIRKELEKKSDLFRADLLDLAGKRKIMNDSLYRADLDHSDRQIVYAAADALGKTGKYDSLDLLLQKCVKADPEQNLRLLQAVRTIALREPDHDLAAKSLAIRFAELSKNDQISILDLLGEIRGEKALSIIVKNVLASDPDLQDNAVRILGSWSDQTAAPYLLEIAQRHPNGKFRLRALRGYIRLIRESGESDSVRIEKCSKAMKCAARTEEKKLVLQACGRIASEESLSVIAGYFQDPDLKGSAFAAAAAVLEKLPKNRSQFADSVLQQIMKERKAPCLPH
ncbi:MAG: HEAT repeat domain-containing protein [Planctomycetia bacterium]|nr:HEAT repeat domain-containing protein [Planctomycetia bacterium]